ncbi:unnamed protein product [Fraxinus pennsylvanica]|uniref:Uncharacterized protein n=1 Tax=Fraxinus pennsylvanica TaxID=56036 RepID=A0AAD1ZEI6_9LAMI|nr:unnamed protein product [Fraxinus pennsylvanica]
MIEPLSHGNHVWLFHLIPHCLTLPCLASNGNSLCRDGQRKREHLPCLQCSSLIESKHPARFPQTNQQTPPPPSPSQPPMAEEEVAAEVETAMAVYDEDCQVVEIYPPHLLIHLKPRTADVSSR